MVTMSKANSRMGTQYARQYPTIRTELNSGLNAPGFPSCIDWENIRRLNKFLEPFFYLTEKVSGTLYTTCNLYFLEICEVDCLLQEWEDDVDLSTMTRKMREKYNKYWSDPITMNKNIFIAVILDPRHKFGFVKYLMLRMFGHDKGTTYADMVKKESHKLFDAYYIMHQNEMGLDRGPLVTNAQQSKEIGSGRSIRKESEPSKKRRTVLRSDYAKYIEGIEGTMEKSELEKYLDDETDLDDETAPFIEDFDVLGWWKVHGPRFPIVAAMARDVFAVPISTVASESAFSIGGRVLDAFRSSLTPRMAQALICGQDWLRSKARQPTDLEDEDELGEMEKDMETLHLDSTILG